MTTQYTPILKLALPVTGELSGTWGDVVNDNITSMVEQAVAGLATVNSWSTNSHTLSTANGTSSESRCAMLVAQDGAGLAAAGEIICPAQSKLYVLKNSTSYAITLKTAAGTGVAVASGEAAFLFCDGTNVNACVTTIVNGHITGNLTVDGNATVNGNTTLGNATSDTVTMTARVASDVLPSADNTYDLGSSANSWKDLYVDGTVFAGTIDLTNLEVTNIKAKDGTAAMSIADSTGVVTLVSNPILSGGTANGVTYLNGSKVLTSGSALTFDGTKLGVGTASPLAGSLVTLGDGTSSAVQYLNAGATGGSIVGRISGSNTWIVGDTANVLGSGIGLINYVYGNNPTIWYNNGSEQMRLTSTGLGIGTSSPAQKLDVSSAGTTRIAVRDTSGTAVGLLKASGADVYIDNSSATGSLIFQNTNGTERMRLDNAGNLGLGITPTTWVSDRKAIQLASGASINGSVATSAFVEVGANFNRSASLTDSYITTAAASKYRQITGAHQWYIAPSGTAGTDITFTQAMTLDASGQLGVGTTSPTNKLDVNVSAAAGNGIILSNGTTGYAKFGMVNYGTDTTTFIGSMSNNAFAFYSNNTEKMRLDSAGNLGLGVTPSAWGSSWKAIQVGQRGALWSHTGNSGTHLSRNTYYNGTNFIYVADGYATDYEQGNGIHYWYSATSGTAGTAITFTQAMTLDASGNLAIGATSANTRLDIAGANTAVASRGLAYIYTTDSQAADKGGQLSFGGSYTGTTQTFFAAVAGRKENGTDATTQGYLQFSTRAATMEERARIDSSGNFGLGVTPSAWLSTYKAFQVGIGASINGRTNVSSQAELTANAYVNSSGAATYIGSDNATKYLQLYGAHSWHTAASGTAGSAITFTQAMTLDASGNLGLGVTPSTWTSTTTGVLQGKGGWSISQDSSLSANAVDFLSNAYRSGAGAYTSIANQKATRFTQYNGSFAWYNAPANGVGGVLTFTQAMTLDASGNLGIGTSSPSTILHVKGNSPHFTFQNTAPGSSGSPTWSGINFNAYDNSARSFIESSDISVSNNFSELRFGTTGSERARIDSSGNLGIGTTSPGAKLDVNGGALIQGLTVGRGAGAVSSNTAVGASALAANTTGSNNTAVGSGALDANQDGIRNTAVGVDTLGSNISGQYNTAVGFQSQLQTTASQNTSLGYRTLYANTDGTYNTAVGTNALNQNTSGTYNTALGISALAANTTSSYNTAVGGLALTVNTTGAQNTALGQAALQNNTTASNNTAVGYQAGYSNTTGINNTLLGFGAGYSGTTANRNTLVGLFAGYSLSTGANNTFVGAHGSGGSGCGDQITTGSKNTIIGSYNGNQGGLDIRTASNYIVLSDGDGNPRGIFDSSGNLLVGTTSLSGAAIPTVGFATIGGYQTATGHASGTGSGTPYSNFCYNGSVIGSITQSGTTAVLFNVTSDQRLKENIVDAAPASELIDSLKVRQFDWKSDGTHQRYGFVAQELVEVAPEAVHQPADPEEMMAVDYSKLVPMLVKEIQSLRARLAAAGIA